MSDDDKIRKIQQALSEAKPVRESRKAPPKKDNVIYINGAGNVVGNSNTVINTQTVINRPKVHVKTGDGVINAEQKAKIQALVKKWVEDRMAVRKSDFSFQAAWAAVNKQAKVNSYHEIPAEKFDAIVKWLQKQIAIVNAMKSAKKKLPTWRSEIIGKIQRRCNALGIQDKRKDWMLTNFGKDSLTKLSDEDVEKVYRWSLRQR